MPPSKIAKPRGKIYLFTGEESFLLQEEVRKWKKLAEEKYGDCNTLTYDLDPAGKNDAELDEATRKISAEMGMPSLFGEKRIIFLENFPPPVDNKGSEEKKRYFNRVLKALENLPENNVAILVSSAPDKRQKIWKEAEKIAEQKKEFAKLKDAEFVQEIQRRAGLFQKKISEKNAWILIELCTGNFWKIHQEIIKLTQYTEQSEISENAIHLLCLPSIEIANFALSNAVQANQIKRAFDIVHDFFDSGEAPISIFNRDIVPVIRQITRVIAAIEEKQDAQSVGMNPWVFDKWKSVAKKFTLKNMQKAYEVLLEIDIGSKSGKIDTSPEGISIFFLLLEIFFLEFFGVNGNKKRDVTISPLLQ